MLILEILLELKSKQGDITAAFLHAELEEGEEVYVAMPQGFKKPGKVLKLRRIFMDYVKVRGLSGNTWWRKWKSAACLNPSSIPVCSSEIRSYASAT